MESSTKPAAPPIDRYQRQIPTSPLPSICPFPTLYSAHPSHMPPRKRHKASSTHPSNQPPSLSQPLSQPDSRPLHPQQDQQQRPGTARFSRTFNHLHSAHALTRDPASDVIGREREREARQTDGRLYPPGCLGWLGMAWAWLCEYEAMHSLLPLCRALLHSQLVNCPVLAAAVGDNRFVKCVGFNALLCRWLDGCTVALFLICSRFVSL
ncbi:uncharacterized protein BKA78DRAFT_121505 [Phyllosticta capitalensis]|uniref:uncharacterized protein n=1 Tax=Phyllosticta capitalensis TaxID=121624 RepID=UPI00312EA176